jgi:branched-chain amino acid transport system permease protein
MIPQIINGLIFASILFLITAGLSIIFGILRIVNFAHGSFYALGIYIAFSITRLSDNILLYLLSPFIAGAVVGLAGVAFERGLLKRIYGRGELFELLLTYGMIFVFMDIFRIGWGSMPISDPTPSFALGTLRFGNVILPVYNLFLLSAAAVIAVFLWFLIYRTRTGMIIRATSFDKEITSAFGVNVLRVYALTFFLGCFLAGFAGGLMLPITGGWIGAELEVLVLALVVLVVGGMGSIKGALVASLLIGIVRAFGISMFPTVELALVYMIMIVVLLVKPTGLFGGAEIERR